MRNDVRRNVSYNRAEKIYFSLGNSCHNLFRIAVRVINLNLNARHHSNVDSHRLLIVALKSRQIVYGKKLRDKLDV